MDTVANADKEYDDDLNYRASKAKERKKDIKDVKDNDSNVGYGHSLKKEKEDSKKSEKGVATEGINALAQLFKGLVGESATADASSDDEDEIINSYNSSVSILKNLVDTAIIKDLEDYKYDKKEKEDSVEDDYSSFVLKPKTINALRELLENTNPTGSVSLGFDLSYNRKNLIDLIHNLESEDYEDVLFDELIMEVLDVVSVGEWTDDSTEAFIVKSLFENLTTSILSDLQDSLSEEE